MALLHSKSWLCSTTLVALLTTGCGGGGGVSAGADSENPGSPEDPADPGDGGSDDGTGGADDGAVQMAPLWASATPSETLTFTHSGGSDSDNGDDLNDAIQALTPGQRLEIGAGTYVIDSRFDVSLAGTEQAPIWIAAKEGEAVVITRSNVNQNTMNVGDAGAGSQYLSFENIHITGGSAGIKMYDCSHLRIDGCEVSYTDGPGIAANSADTDNLYITNNHVHHCEGSGEGMYLGANHSAYVMRDSVIAGNHVHDTNGSQGDGIEVKQGSYGNLIAFNHVHDCRYPCIISYGTDGNEPNVIEGNVCYNCNEYLMQVQGEAIVRNNLLINGDGGFLSTDHQGQTRDLTFVHNTIVTSGRAAYLSSWTNREGMVFANNVVYSQDTNSIRFSGGSAGVVVSGNVVRGSVTGASAGFVTGSGLSDFMDLSWDASTRDATPVVTALQDGADPLYAVQNDLRGNVRTRSPAAVGCLD